MAGLSGLLRARSSSFKAFEWIVLVQQIWRTLSPEHHLRGNVAFEEEEATLIFDLGLPFDRVGVR